MASFYFINRNKIKEICKDLANRSSYPEYKLLRLPYNELLNLLSDEEFIRYSEVEITLSFKDFIECWNNFDLDVVKPDDYFVRLIK